MVWQESRGIITTAWKTSWMTASTRHNHHFFKNDVCVIISFIFRKKAIYFVSFHKWVSFSIAHWKYIYIKYLEQCFPVSCVWRALTLLVIYCTLKSTSFFLFICKGQNEVIIMKFYNDFKTFFYRENDCIPRYIIPNYREWIELSNSSIYIGSIMMIQIQIL